MKFGSLIFLTFFIVYSSSQEISYPTELTQLPSACNDLENGYHWIRPIEGTNDDGIEYPNLYVYCSEGFTIIDPSLVDDDNKQHPKYYMSSWAYATDVVASSSLDDHPTWAQWWKPSTDSTLFRVSPDCKTCDATTEHGERSVYYMTGNYIGCLWITKGYCDMDPDTMECYTCTAPGLDEKLSGLCTHMETDADTPVNSAHDDCVGTSYNAEPSIGVKGQFCVCYKPETSTIVNAATWNVPETKPTITAQTSSSIIQLYASDFERGTYRITEPGYYIIMEDIEFNMNEGDYDNPNAEGAWYPTKQQSNAYDGVDDSFVGAYSMGFFAGITVEATDVTIDLNGHTLAMSKVFHLQQRWFSIIELGNKAFISGQGPGNFGAFMDTCKSVIIKGGTLGLSSHHGIHGNGAENIVIKNIVIKDFEVGGISLNGFENLQIDNVEIGPIYQSVPVLGVYTQARIMLQRLRRIAEENPDTTITIANRDKTTYTANDILEELASQMDIVFDHYINNVEWNENDDRTIKARQLFENINGIPSASTVYGIYLNSEGASVFSIGGAPGTSKTASIKNVYIHSLYNDPWEVPRIVLTKGPFNDIMDSTRVSDDGLEDLTKSKYIGSAYTDAQFALHKLTDSWSILGHSVLKSKADAWISQGTPLGKNMKIRCNNDIMLHVTKGVFGLRVDNIENIDIDKIIIEDIQNVGILGSYLCGAYTSEDDGGHRNQNYPLQYGYTGTEVHGLTLVGSTGKVDNVEIRSLISARGDAIALQVWPGNEVEIGTVKIEDIHAGAYLYEEELPAVNLPNKVPRACAVDYWTWFDDDSGFYENSISYNLDQITAKCFTSHMSCAGSGFGEDLITEYGNCDENNLIVNNEWIRTGDVYETIVGSSADTTAVSTTSSYKSLLDIMKKQNSKHSEYAKKRNFYNPGYHWLIYTFFICAVLIAIYKYYISKSQKLQDVIFDNLKPSLNNYEHIKSCDDDNDNDVIDHIKKDNDEKNINTTNIENNNGGVTYTFYATILNKINSLFSRHQGYEDNDATTTEQKSLISINSNIQSTYVAH